MNVPVSLQHYAQLVQRINAEVVNHLSAALLGSANFKLVPNHELCAGAVFGARNNTHQVVVRSALVPFTFDQSNSLLVEVDRAIFVSHGSTRSLGSRDWQDDRYFADNGVMTVCAPSISEEDIEAAAAQIAHEIKSHLAFEKTFARSYATM